MVFAAGLGARLRPLTAELPKPALPVANVPLVWFSLDFLARSGIQDVALNTHYLAERLNESVSLCAPKSLRIRVIHEPVILGAGGGLKNAWRPMDGETFVVMNADMIFAPDLHEALEVHRRAGAIATMVLRPMPESSGYGPVQIDARGMVRRVLEYPREVAGPLSTYMFTGVHLLHPRAWRDLPDNGCIIRTSYFRWLERGEVIASVIDSRPWTDLGTPPDYLEANCAFASGKIKWPGIVADGAGVIRDRTARVGAGAALEQVVLGPDSEAAPGSRLNRVIVWRGARIGGELSNAVVTPAGVVKV